MAEPITPEYGVWVEIALKKLGYETASIEKTMPYFVFIGYLQ